MSVNINIHRANLALRVAIWASGLSASQKLVAACIADHYNDALGLAWPSLGRVATMCSLSETTARGHVRALVGIGFLAGVARNDRPENLQWVRTNVWRINADALPAGRQGELLGGAAGCVEATDDVGGAAEYRGPDLDIQGQSTDLRWPELDWREGEGVVYSDGYVPEPAPPDPPAVCPAVFEGVPPQPPHPELGIELFKTEDALQPVDNFGVGNGLGASPRRRALPAADVVKQGIPFGVLPETWAGWLDVRRGKGRRGVPTAADLAALEESAKSWLPGDAGALQKVMAVCVERKWLRFNPEWLKSGAGIGAGVVVAAGPVVLSDDGLRAQRIAQGYGLGVQRGAFEVSPESVARRNALLAATRERIGTVRPARVVQ